MGTYSQVFTDEKRYLLCISDGLVDGVESFYEWAEALMGKACATRHSKVLIDNRTFELHLSFPDVITFATCLDEMNAASLELNLAVLPSPKNVEISKLVEVSLVHQTASYKCFKSQEEATCWL